MKRSGLIHFNFLMILIGLHISVTIENKQALAQTEAAEESELPMGNLAAGPEGAYGTAPGFLTSDEELQETLNRFWLATVADTLPQFKSTLRPNRFSPWQQRQFFEAIILKKYLTDNVGTTRLRKKAISFLTKLFPRFDIHSLCGGEVSILELAVQSGYKTLLRAFMRHPTFDINKRDSRGYAPLHLAILNRQTVLAEFLIVNGADTNTVIERDPSQFFRDDLDPQSGDTPLHLLVKMALSAHDHNTYKEMLKLIRLFLRPSSSRDKIRSAKNSDEKTALEIFNLVSVKESGSNLFFRKKQSLFEEFQGLLTQDFPIDDNSNLQRVKTYSKPIRRPSLKTPPEPLSELEFNHLFSQFDFTNDLGDWTRLRDLLKGRSLVQKHVRIFYQIALLASENTNKQYSIGEIKFKAITQLNRLFPNVDVQSEDDSGQSLLHLAFSTRVARVVMIVMQAKTFEVDRPDSYGRAPLHLALIAGMQEIAHYLVDKRGAQIANAITKDCSALESEREVSRGFKVLHSDLWDKKAKNPILRNFRNISDEMIEGNFSLIKGDYFLHVLIKVLPFLLKGEHQSKISVLLQIVLKINELPDLQYLIEAQNSNGETPRDIYRDSMLSRKQNEMQLEACNTRQMLAIMRDLMLAETELPRDEGCLKPAADGCSKPAAVEAETVGQEMREDRGAVPSPLDSALLGKRSFGEMEDNGDFDSGLLFALPLIDPSSFDSP